jgi:hypothetical protein
MEAGLKLWKENSVNWIAMKNALHFVDRMLGEIWRVHCNHKKNQTLTPLPPLSPPPGGFSALYRDKITILR